MGWGGRVTDEQSTKESGFFNEFSMSDCILAGRGFNVKEELSLLGATLKILSLRNQKNSFQAVKWIRQDSFQLFEPMRKMLQVELKNLDLCKLRYYRLK